MSSDERSMPATKGDILRIEQKMDQITTTVNVLNTAVAVIQARPQYNQPCSDFLEYRRTHSPCKDLCQHLKDHEDAEDENKEEKKDWRGFILGLASAAIIGLVGYFFRK